MKSIRIKIIPSENRYLLVIESSFLNDKKPFGLYFSDGELSPAEERFAPFVSQIEPYLTEIKKVIESGEFIPNKPKTLPLKTDGWVN